MKKSELPPEIKGLREVVARNLYFLRTSTRQKPEGADWEKCKNKRLWLSNAGSLLSKLTELGVRIKINGKWYGLDGTPREG